jgi:hypothetical protein
VTGVDLVGGVGALATAHTIPLGGQDGALGSGTVGFAKDGSAALTSVSALVLAGTVSAGSDIVVALTGAAATATAGSIGPAIGTELSGVTAAAGVQGLTTALDIAISGEAAVVAAGVVGGGTVVEFSTHNNPSIDDEVLGLAADIEGSPFSPDAVDDPLGVVLAYD